jgi:hypothetical protein
MSMDILHDAVKKLEQRIAGSGAEDGIVTIDTDPRTVYCQYEKGACLRAQYGGRAAEFITTNPLTAKTKIGFMFGASLESLPQRSAAGAILNVATGFFCISRVLKSCIPTMHRDCIAALGKEIGTGRIYPVGLQVNILARLGPVADNPDEGDVFLIVGDGLIAAGTGDLLARFAGKKRILFLGPSTARSCSAGIRGPRPRSSRHWYRQESLAVGRMSFRPV